MSLIDEHSAECTKSELELFTVPPTQTAIERSHYVKHYPLTTLSRGSPLEFKIVTGSNEYLDGSTILLYTKNKIVQDDNTTLTLTEVVDNQQVMPDKAKVAPINYFHATRFKTVEVFLNGKCITDSNNLYPYRAIFELLLSYGMEALECQFESALFAKDQGKLEDVSNSVKTKTTAKSTGNLGYQKRFNRTKASKTFECVGPIHCELFTQNKLPVLNNSELKIILRQHDTKFSLQGLSETTAYSVQIEEAYLFVEHKEISNAVLEAHQLAIQKMNAKYPLVRTVMKYFTFGSERGDLSVQHLHTGQIPKKVFFALVDNSAFSGNIKKNPFNFQNFNVGSVSLRVDGTAIPFETLKLNFENKEVGQGYFALLHSLNRLYKNEGLPFTLDDYCNGYALYGFDLTPDSGDCSFSLVKEGTLSLDVKLSEPTTVAVSLVCLLQLDDIMEISQDQNVTL